MLVHDEGHLERRSIEEVGRLHLYVHGALGRLLTFVTVLTAVVRYNVDKTFGNSSLTRHLMKRLAELALRGIR